ncbi:Anthocyanidin 3-O-glucosyltransferase 5 [Turnera subulata]|uniref:Glycosyltransferase n=1 Tax=Turnera subulata TaxID=218843 RepID=A0A9Q0FRV3_9ROSI|nr:Anthocyanidin 3-O-glucosyltransferase 5 [Turnera subulata]
MSSAVGAIPKTAGGVVPELTGRAAPEDTGVSCDPAGNYNTRTFHRLQRPLILPNLLCLPYLLAMAGLDSKPPHVVLLASPGMGHLIPVLVLGKRLVTLHNFKVTIFVVASHSSGGGAESDVLQAATSQNLCQVVELPAVDMSGVVSPGAAVVTQLAVMMREIKPALRSAISALEHPPAALIVDLFGSESMAVADEFGVPKFVYVPSNAWFLALSVYSPILDKVVEGEYVNQKEPLAIPGCTSVRPEDVVDPMLDRTNQQYVEYVRMGVEYTRSDGILLNTWEDLQPTTLAALRDEKLLGRVVKVPVYPIGPLLRTTEQPSSESLLFHWLDSQPRTSVIYVSFGSGGTLSVEQMVEVAWGLELSQQRFVWVVRKPTAKSGDGSFFTSGNGRDDDPLSYLPQGFLTRTHNLGLMVRDWAPQTGILSHPSTGGFLSHCGWNSTLESITNGVPMIAWPMYAEQRLNATLLVEELGVAIRPRFSPSKAVVRREEIAEMIRKVMVEEEGANIRKQVAELKCRAEKALSEGGSSRKALSQVAKECELSWERLSLKSHP